MDSLLAGEDLSNWRGEAVKALESMLSFGNTTWHLVFREGFFLWETRDLLILMGL